MGFFFNPVRVGAPKTSAAAQQRNHVPIESMNQIGCKACPLDKNDKIDHPKMEAVGAQSAAIYFLGDSPSEEADLDGEPLSTKEEKLLLSQFPRSLEMPVRIHNTIRCHKPGYTNGMPNLPEQAETECCRGYITKDIEAAQPLVVVGGGAVPLTWATGLTGGITKWRGKLIATKIGKHPCWYYPIFHPSHVLNKKKDWGKSEVQGVFENDLLVLQDMIDAGLLQPPRLYERDFDKGIEIFTGESAGDFKRLEDLLNVLVKLPSLGIDLETIGLRPYASDARIITCAVGSFDKVAAFALDHPEASWGASTLKRVWGLLWEFIAQSGTKIAHNLAFEQEWLAHQSGDGRILRLTEWADTMAQAHTLDERPGKALGDLTRQYFGFDLKTKSRVDVTRILDFPLKDVLVYNGMDSKWVNPLYDVQRPLVEANKDYVVEYERKVRLCPTLVLTQLKGMDVDFDYALIMQTTFQEKVKNLDAAIAKCPEVKAYEKRFGTFRPTAPEDVIKMMRDICKREEIKVEGANDTSGEEALRQMPIDEVPSANLILKHRTAAKLLSTYIDPVIRHEIVAPDGKVHTQYSSMRAVSGRLASDSPNIQNWPSRQHKEIRGMLCAPKDMWMVACDYGQIEARVIAMASEDETLIKYLWTNYDIHGYWADRIIRAYGAIKDWVIAEVFPEGMPKDVDPDKAIRKALRQECKSRWVFALFYGSHIRSCAASFNLPMDIAEMLSDEFWDEFAGTLRWQERLIKKYEKNLYVETLSGRRRRGVISNNELINHPIQGSACDIVTEAMNVLSIKAQTMDDDHLQPIFNGHDDLTFYLPDEGMESRLDIISTEMCRHRFDYINVPIVLEVKIGTRWNDLHEIGVYRSNNMFGIMNPYEH